MIVFIFLLLLHFTSADLLTDHLYNNVDVSVKPCDDFYRHVCSQSVNQTEFPFRKISEFYRSIANKFINISSSLNLPIMYDIAKLHGTEEATTPVFNRTVYETLVRARCNRSDECYREEFSYFYEIYNSSLALFPQYSDQKHLFLPNKRLDYFASNINKTNSERIMEILPRVVESSYSLVPFDNSVGHPTQIPRYFYAALMNRLFVMEHLKENGIFEKIVNINDDLKQFKAIFIKRFQNTPWMNEKDGLGLSMLAEFEDKINELVVYYDLDESDRDLEILRRINNKFVLQYYEARHRTTGIEIFDTLLSLNSAFSAIFINCSAEEKMLIERVIGVLEFNAFYKKDINKAAILAPFVFPELTDKATLNKPYNLFSIIGHEMAHSIISPDWANRSSAFKNGMDCLIKHYNRTCQTFGLVSCNSGVQTFTEDGPDLFAMQTNYEFLTQNYNATELKENIFEADELSVNRVQALFYLWGMTWCGTIEEVANHTDVHSLGQVRINGLVTQMPEFSAAFSCAPGERMFADKERTCHLFGPDSK